GRGRMGTQQVLVDAGLLPVAGAEVLAQHAKITAEDEAFIDSLVTPGHASTHGYNDAAHFVSGRQPR
ncbi:hypothetical protein ACQKLJ_17800, partial [Pseudomonas qingdaonensis]